jgi:hypothetical protein
LITLWNAQSADGKSRILTMTDMPNPIPEALKEAASVEWNDTPGNPSYAKDCLWFYERGAMETIARLLWKGGWREPVDPDVESVKRILRAWCGFAINEGEWGGLELARAVAVYKDIRELERQGNDG